MTLRIGDFPPGEELMDVDTFFALHSRHEAAPEPPVDALGVGLPGIELTEVSFTMPGRNADPAHEVPSVRERPSGDSPRPPASPAAAAALEAEIDRCPSREHVARLAVHLARAYSPAATLFLVHRGMIATICGEGSAIRREELRFPADAPGLFAEVVASGEPFRGAPPPDGFEGRILRLLGRQHAREIVVLPVAIRGRVVNLLYADNGPEALGDASVAALSAVCARVSRAYQRLILERKAESTVSTSVIL
jgi:hypothetical protein